MVTFYCVVETERGLRKVVVEADNGFEAVRKALRVKGSVATVCSTNPKLIKNYKSKGD